MPRYSFQDRYHRNEPIPQAEALTVINGAKDLPLSAAIAMLYLFGPRVSEILKLEKRDFEILKKYLRVRMPTLKTGNPDSYRVLRVPLKAPCIDKILVHLETIQVPEEKVFKFSRWTIWREIRRQDPNASPHWFRHTRATRLAERSTDQLGIQAWFGWRDSRTPLHYIQISGKMAERLSDLVD